MKKVLSIWVTLLGALVTVGCQTEKMPVEEMAAGSKTLRVIANADDTRTAVFQDQNTGKYKVRWDEYDRLTLWELIYANWENDLAHAAWAYRATPLTLEEDGRRATFDFELEDNQAYLPENEVFRYIGIYGSAVSPLWTGQDVTVEDWEAFWGENYTSDHLMLLGSLRYNQSPSADSFDPNSDVLISRMVESAVQPEEVNLSFARIGSIVKMTLKNLPAGYYVYSGKFTAGSSWVVSGSFGYDPELERVLPISFGGETSSIEFEPQDVVVNEAGEAVIWLRTFSGRLTDSFSVEVTLSPDGETPSMKKYEKVVNLNGEQKSLFFREGDITAFSVRMEEATPIRFTSETLAYFPELESDHPVLRFPMDYDPSDFYWYGTGMPFLFESQYTWDVSIQLPDSYVEDYPWIEMIETAGGCWLRPGQYSLVPQAATLVLTCLDGDVDPIEIPVEGYNIVTIKINGAPLKELYDQPLVCGRSYTVTADLQAPSWLEWNEESISWEVDQEDNDFLSYESDGTQLSVRVNEITEEQRAWMAFKLNCFNRVGEISDQLAVYFDFIVELRPVPLMFNNRDWHKQTLKLAYEEAVTLEADMTGIPVAGIDSFEWNLDQDYGEMSITPGDQYTVTVNTGGWQGEATLELRIVMKDGTHYRSWCRILVRPIKLLLDDTRLYGEPITLRAKRSYTLTAIPTSDAYDYYTEWGVYTGDYDDDYDYIEGTGKFFALYFLPDPQKVTLRTINPGQDYLICNLREYGSSLYDLDFLIEVQ